MPDPTRATCQNCGRHRDEVGPISWGGNCRTCSLERFTDNLVGLVTHTGPYAEHHRRRLVASFGGVILDETADPA